MYHVPLAVQCIYGGSDEGVKEENEIPGGWERVKIAWSLVCRCLGHVW